MNGRSSVGVAAALHIFITGTLAFSQTEGPGAKPGLPGWFLAGTAPDPGGRRPVGPGGRVKADPGAGRGGPLAACAAETAKYCTGQSGFGSRACLAQNSDRLSAQCRTALDSLPVSSVPNCSHSPVCDNRLGGTRRDLQRV